ncbi:MAG: Hsp20/alpha crystallin family protein [Ketobacteraceae bacterium]|nr:Hsp20/alpha crystallin family protein [Ketobacteraceae bacterium]
MNSGNRWLKVFAAICVISVAALGYYSWTLHRQVSDLEQRVGQVSGPAPAPVQDFWSDNWDPWADPWDPTGEFAEMKKRMDEMMNRMMPGGSIFSNRGFGLSSTSPTVKMTDTGDAYEVTVSTPQGQEVELNTQLSDGILTVSGKMRRVEENSAGNGTGRVVATSQFSQTITLPEPVEQSAMTIDRQGGKVTVKIPKA